MYVRGFLVPLALVAAAAALACRGNPIPLSAQKGSTVMIPIGGLFEEDTGQIAFGSEVYEDRQRGDLVIKLDDENGPELVTRAVTTLAGPLASQHGIGSPFGPRSDLIVVLADIPNLPAITEGPHGLHIVRRLGGVDYPGPIYTGEFQVLPASVPTTGGPVDGASTPFESFDFAGVPLDFQIKSSVPDPQLIFATTVATHSAEFEVAYLHTKIDILDVTEATLSTPAAFPGVSTSHRATVWHRPVMPGVIAVGIMSPDRPIRGVSIVFKLKATATQPYLALNSLLLNARSYDASGDLIAPGWSAPWIR